MFDEENELNPLDLEERTIEDLLESLSLDTVRDSIVGQIRGTIAPNRDFLGIVISKVHTILDTIVDTGMIREIENDVTDFCQSIMIEFPAVFHICLHPAEEDSLNHLTMLDAMYNFFIIRRESYVRDFLLDYITQNKTIIIDQLGLGLKKTDVSTLAGKKRDMERDDIAIISSINEVMDYIREDSGVTPDTFFNTIDDGEYYIRTMMDYYANCEITGNFVPTYLDMVLDECCSEAALRVRNDIRIKLYQSSNLMKQEDRNRI